MKTTFILLIMSIVIAKTTNAQTSDECLAEEFIAEVFYGYMTEKSPKEYIEKQTWVTSANSKNLCEKFGICDTLLYEFMDIEWNTAAPVFKLPKYKNLIFVEDVPVPKRARKQWSYTNYFKPIFTKSRKYAVIDLEYTTCHLIKSSWKWSWKKCWIIKRREYECNGSVYQQLYQRIDGNWIQIGKFSK